MNRYLSGLAALLLLLSACSEEPTNPAADGEYRNPGMSKLSDASGKPEIVDRYIVVFKDNVMNAETMVDELTRGIGAQVHFRYGRVLKGFAATIPAQALEGIRRNPNVSYIEQDAYAGIDVQSNPPSWGLDRIDQVQLPLDNQYAYPNTGSEVTVYILDSGIRMDHVEYSSRVVSGYDFIDNDADASDCHGHGTHVAGTVGGTNVGVAKGATLVAVRVLDCSGWGLWSQIIAGIDWVVNTHSGPSVINMSISGNYSSSVNSAVNSAVASGIVCVVAAGNDNVDASTKSPASAADAITVGATTSNDARSSFSNYGSVLDIFAPGSGIYSSTITNSNSYASWSGTSMAAPHVAGAAALYMSANSSATPTQVVNALTSTAVSGTLSGIGSGSPNLLLHNQFGGSNTLPPAPSAPSSLTAGSATTSSISLAWVDNANNESGFSIERSLNGSTWSQIATVGADVTGYVNSGLSSGTTYSYRVRAYNSGGNSAYSNTASAATQSISTVSVHVSAASGSATIVGKNKWRGALQVTVKDASNQPVAGATVSVSWSGGTSGSATAITGSTGVAAVSTPEYNTKAVKSLNMTVDDVSGSGISYDSSANTASLPVFVKP
jgi:hypothetical protein